MSIPKVGDASRRFHSTCWTVVLSAGLHSPDARTAFESLYVTYSYPLYAYLRSKSQSSADAAENVQAFFSWLIEKEVVSRADPERGRFRSFLLKSLGNFLLDQRKYENAAKRRPDQPLISVDTQQAETRFRAQPADNATPDKLFDRAWAVSILEQAMRRLCAECRFRVDGPCAICLNGCLTGDLDVNTNTAAEKMQLSPGAVRVALHRLRKRFGEIVREEVAQTVAAPEEVDDEIRQLITLVAKP